MKKKKIILGRKDKLDFPGLSLFDIDTKIDTGAYTSAIHCKEIKFIQQDNSDYVNFTLDNGKNYTMPLFTERAIKNSFGQVEKRFVIHTTVKIFDKMYPVEISLTDRSLMEYPVLIGRRLLHKIFLVDVSKKELSFKKKSKRLRDESMQTGNEGNKK